ncbi:MAG: anaerobic ribonucleoside-triphosphate reductase, partial [Lachnoanaerobaculum sp.]|nr:anaerobic ribonucleoside-triphosphate reductase [Lachnoanaerobaculum sp.]
TVLPILWRTSMSMNRAMSVEEIQDMVEDGIMRENAYEVARKYITYRYVQSIKRKNNTTDDKILSLIECDNEEVKQENSNKNPTVASVQRDYMAGEVSKDLTERILLDSEVVEAHKAGILHFHDADYFAQHMHNCDLVNLEDMLQNGTVISGTFIEKPHSFSTACNIATQIIAQVASSQYGGQSISLTHLAPFVDVSRKKIRDEIEAEMYGLNVSNERKEEIVENRLRKEITKGVQTIQYQVVTLMTTNGQAPFITVFMYLNEAKNEQEKEDLALIIEEMIRQRYQGVKNESGVWVTPAFPKLIYVLEEDNVRPGSRYYHLTKLAAKCTAKRLVPDYVSEKKMFEYKIDKNGNGNCYTPMGCRSFLTPYVDENGKPKYYGRFNQGVVTINLVDVALSSGGDTTKFWDIFDERLELCHRALRARHERLKGTPSDVAPILWQYGALGRLKKGEPIDKLLYGGYSTISLGYAGLYECVKYMTGKSHTDDAAKPFALSVMQRMNDKCNEWKKAENIDYSPYGTPLESTTYKFAKALQKRFGIIEGITDKNYITNSYHVHVAEDIDAFTKLKFESEFQKLSPGGAISYVEVPNMQDNLEAVMSLLGFIYDNIMYAELNTKSDYCQECGYDGEIKIVKDKGKLLWKCPKCGNTDQSKLNVARRTCGYIGTQFWNQGRTQEIADRVLHL